MTGLYFYNANYSQVSTFHFEIWANDPSENWNSISSSFTISDSIPPISRPGNNMNILEGGNLTFNGSGSYDNTGTIVNYTWTISKNGEVFAILYGITPSFTFNEPGNYTVTLIVKDGSGLSGQDSIKITVTEVDHPGGEVQDDPWWIITLVIVIILLSIILAILLWRKRKKSVYASPPESEPTQD